MTCVRFTILFILVAILFVTCNSNNVSQTSCQPIDIASDSTLISENSSPEDALSNKLISKISEKYEANLIQKGEYIPFSVNEKFTGLIDNVIEPHQLRDTILSFNGNYQYLADEKPIALFNKMYPKDNQDVLGMLLKGSLVYVDTVFYNNIYMDSDYAPMSFEKWYELLDNKALEVGKSPLTYDVWYAVRINGKRYYTDCKLHNYIEYKKYLPSKKQLLLICSQGTGYDGSYDNGYPEFYGVVVFQEPQTKDEGWKQIYCSDNLDLNGGGVDEYGLSELFVEYASEDYISPVFIDERGNLIINYENYWRLAWDGRDLSVDWNKNYLNR